jgi:hypothetical protein
MSVAVRPGMEVIVRSDAVTRPLRGPHVIAVDGPAAAGAKSRAADVGEDPNKGGPINEFFTQVGRGLVAAQQLLDDETRRYLAGGPPVAGMFRIPKVTAELRLEATRKDSRNYFWVFSKSSESNQSQSVSFEIAAAPPPVEVLEHYRRFMSLGVLVIDTLTRDELLESLRAAGGRAEAFVDRFREVLVLAASPGGNPREGDFILVLAANSGAAEVQVAFVGVPERPDGRSRKVTLPPRALNLDGFNPLWLLVSRLGREQADALPPDH